MLRSQGKLYGNVGFDEGSECSWSSDSETMANAAEII